MTNKTTPPTVLPTPGGPTGMEVRQLMRSLPQTPKRAVLYARTSTDNERALSGQLETLRARAADQGYEIVAEITDPGEPGIYLDRPGLDYVRDLVCDDGVDVVLAHGRDRFAREPTPLCVLQEEFARYGTRLQALNTRGEVIDL